MGKLNLPVGQSDHAQGSPSAPVTLVEYGDYECPHCGRAYPILKSIQKKMGTKLRFVFRNFPLTQMHPNAELAAEAAEAAGSQGKFWEMHDAIYENQSELSPDLIDELAIKLKLNHEQFLSDLESRKFKTRVKNDFMGGVKSGVSGTPGLFINGELLEGPWDEQSLLELLESMAK